MKNFSHLLRNKKFVFGVKATISALLVVWLIFFVEWREVARTIADINPWYVALYVCVYVCGLAVSAHKWRILAAFKGFSYTLPHFFRWYLIGTFVNNFMPSFIGGDAYRAYALGRENKNYIAASATIVADRVTGFVGVMALTVFFGALAIGSTVTNGARIALYIAGILTLLGIMAVILLRRAPCADFLARVLPLWLSHYLRDIWHYRAQRIFWPAMIYAVIFSFVGLAAANYLLFLAVGIAPALLSYLGIIFFISIVSSLPISIGNIGVKEWAYILFFVDLGISSSVAVTVVFIGRVLQMLVSIFAVPLYLNMREDFVRERKEMSSAPAQRQS